MRTLNVFSLLGVLSFSAWATPDFFTDSYRLSPNESESKKFIQVFFRESFFAVYSCSAFFVANRDNKAFVATQRHCFNYKEVEACSTNKIEILPAGKNAPFKGKCKRLIAANAHHDIMIMEVELYKSRFSKFDPEFHRKTLKQYEHLKLADYKAPAGTDVTMYGFPGDNDDDDSNHFGRNGRATVTSGCQVKADDTRLSTKSSQRVIKASGYKADMRRSVKTKLGRFNCDVYGGNSGGPIVRNGTNHVLGIPHTYVPGNFHRYDSESRATLFQRVDNFVDKFRGTLNHHNIIFGKDPSVPPETLVQWLPGNVYTTNEQASPFEGCDLYFSKSRNSKNWLKVTYQNCPKAKMNGEDHSVICRDNGHQCEVKILFHRNPIITQRDDNSVDIKVKDDEIIYTKNNI